jgi:hypothetical protein
MISATAVSLNPRRTVEFLVPLIWRTVGYLVRALIMRLFAMIGLPVSPLVSYLRPTHPKGESIESQARARVGDSKARSSKVAKVEYPASEKSEGASELVPDSATEFASSVGGEKWQLSRTFNIPQGPFSLLAHTELTVDTDGDEKIRPPLPDVVLDGERMDLKVTALDHGWTIMQSKGDVDGGKVEICGMAASTRNGCPH